MKRSAINAALKELEAMVNIYRFALPLFGAFMPEEWNDKGHAYDRFRKWGYLHNTAKAQCSCAMGM
ncbi:MAG: D-lyxose/D-mannose family sugar isomerase [Lachnospiraceae bacterium]